MTKAQRRHLFGESYDCYELTCPAWEPNSYQKLLKEAVRVITEQNPDSVKLSGIFWDPQNDEYVLDLMLSNA